MSRPAFVAFIADSFTAFACRFTAAWTGGFRFIHVPLMTVVLISVFISPASFIVRGEPLPSDAFSTTVAPILIQRCLECHGGDSVEGGYDISTLAGIWRAGDSSAAPLVAADPDASELFRRLVTDDESELMPSGGPPLDEGEIESIRQWILSGGEIAKGGKEARLIDSLAAITQYPLPPETYPRPLPVTAIAAGNGDGLLVVGGYRELLAWRDLEKNAVPERWQGFDVSVSAITITTAGDWIAVAHGSPGQRGEVTLARLTQAGLQDRSTVLRTADVPSAVAFSPTGDLLAITTLDGSLTVIEVPADDRPEGETLRSDARKVEVRGDNGAEREGLTGGSPATGVRLDLAPHSDAIAEVAWSADGDRLLTASRDRTARVIRLQDGQSISNYAQHDRAVHGVCQIKAGTLTLDETGTLRLWAAESRTPMLSRQRVSDVALGLHRYQDSVLIPSSGRIMRISVEQVEQEDGTDKDGKPKTRKVPKWKDLTPLEIDPADVIVSLAVSPDGTVLAGTQTGRIYRWVDGATASEPTSPLPPLVALPR